MYLLYCFLAFLSCSLHNASKNLAKEEKDIPMIYNSMGTDMWFLLTGQIIPIVVMLIYAKWYLGVIYIVAGILGTMILANQYMYKYHIVKRPPLYIPSRADAKPSIVISITSLIVLLIFFVS